MEDNNRVIEYYKENVEFGNLSKKLFNYMDENSDLVKLPLDKIRELNNKEESSNDEKFILQYGYGFNIKGRVDRSINKNFYGYIPICETNVKYDVSKVQYFDEELVKKKILKFIEYIIVLVIFIYFLFNLIYVLSNYHIITIIIAEKLGGYTIEDPIRYTSIRSCYLDMLPALTSFGILSLYSFFKIKKIKRLKRIKRFDKVVKIMEFKYNYNDLLQNICDEINVSRFKKIAYFKEKNKVKFDIYLEYRLIKNKDESVLLFNKLKEKLNYNKEDIVIQSLLTSSIRSMRLKDCDIFDGIKRII